MPADFTLLAPDDAALTPPHHRRPHKQEASADSGPQTLEYKFDEVSNDLFEQQTEQPLPHPFHSKELRRHARRQSAQTESAGKDKDKDGDDDDEHERKRKFLSKVIGYILSYHVVPERLSEWELANHATVPSALDTSRIKVEPTWNLFPHPYPSLKFNLYARKRGPTILAKNGVIHLVGAPLLPPLSPLNKLFLFPQAFATLTSGLQKVDLADGLLPEMPHSDEADVEQSEDSSSLMTQLIDELAKEHGLSQFTVFAPTNFAFARLG